MNATDASPIDVAGRDTQLRRRSYGTMLGSPQVQAAYMGARLGWQGGSVGAYVPAYDERVSLLELA